MTADPVDWEALEALARAARQNAYAPYSGYRVGAAIRSADGRVFSGCNVENASFGLCLCAERNAVGSLVANGAQGISAVVVVTAGPRVGTPCGMCRQVLFELTDDAPVRLVAVADDGSVIERRDTSVAVLLPDGFRGDLVPSRRS